MYQIAIVEDEEIYAKMLEEFIHRYERDSSHQFKIRHYRDGSEIAENYRGGFDIILMDIQMRFMDGMTAAEMIRKRDPEVLIIFITNRSDYAVRGYEVDALDYVVKPVEYFSFSQKLDRAVARRGRSRDYHIMVHADGGLYKLSASQILFVESERHNVHFYMTTGKLTSRMNMHEVEDLLRGFGFYRAERDISSTSIRSILFRTESAASADIMSRSAVPKRRNL